MKSSSDLCLYDLTRLAIIGQPGLFENLTSLYLSAYPLTPGDLYFCITKYYVSSTKRTYRFSKAPRQLSNLDFVRELFKLGFVVMEEDGLRKLEVCFDPPNSHQSIEAALQFSHFQSHFIF